MVVSGLVHINMAKTLVLNKGDISIAISETETLVATVLPDDATDPSVTWESNDPDVATVSDAGLVTGVAAGVAVIMAKAGDKVAACAVIVTEE